MSEGTAPPPESESDPAAARQQKRRTFRERLGSTMILWVLVTVAMVFGNTWGFLALVSTVVLLSVWEYFSMLEVTDIAPWRNAVVTASAVYIAGCFWLGHHYGAQSIAEFDGFAVALVTGLVFFMQYSRKLEGQDTTVRLMSSLFGFLYLPFLFGFVIKTLYLPGPATDGVVLGHFYALYLIVVTKFSDMGAYLVGSVIGKHKMIPHISPKKTWEGFAGAAAFSVGGSYAMVALFGDQMPLINWMHAGILGLLLGLVAVAGDLAESVLKRSWHAKDSGSLLPGIGGTLDLIDSLCFTAPVLYFYLRFLT